jgi:hypothetical protein
MSENKTVNFSDLKRKEVKCIIFENVEGGITAEYNSNKIKELLFKLENPIIIYNPSQKQKAEIQKIINSRISKETKDIEISGEDLLITLLPLLSNVILDLHKETPEDEAIINEIINDPSPIFERAINIIKEIVKEIGSLYINTLKDILELPKEEREKLIKQNAPDLSDKEKKKLELQKQLEELDKEETINIEDKK